MTMQTISHKNGHINVSDSTITAWSHGRCLGDHYSTVAGAKAAITKAHKQWLSECDRSHRDFMQSAFG